MDNKGEKFLGGPPSGRNNNVRGGSEMPNILFSPGLRAVSLYSSFVLAATLGEGEEGI